MVCGVIAVALLLLLQPAALLHAPDSYRERWKKSRHAEEKKADDLLIVLFHFIVQAVLSDNLRFLLLLPLASGMTRFLPALVDLEDSRGIRFDGDSSLSLASCTCSAGLFPDLRNCDEDELRKAQGFAAGDNDSAGAMRFKLLALLRTASVALGLLPKMGFHTLLKN